MSSTDILILQRNAHPKMAKLSSLELMLDRIQQREDSRNDDDPPALPSRPVSKARQPPGRKRTVLPFLFQEVGSIGGGEIKLFKNKRTEASSVENGCLLLNKIGRVNDGEERALQGVVEIQKYFRGHQARCHYHELKRVMISLQAYVRGENARKDYQVSKERPMEDECVPVLYSKVVDLQRRVLRAEAELGNKNEENAALQLRLEQFDRKWQQYEAKMKSMEKMWQDQLASIQVRLAAENGRRVCENSDLTLDGAPQRVNGRVHTIKHFIEQHERGMTDDDSNSDNGLGSTQLDSNTNPDKELRKLKTRFKAWNKDYKTRLRETKATLNKPENSKAKMVSCRWWER